jgi:DNA helicase-2/ATP-dependent DNA helicase PcrA
MKVILDEFQSKAVNTEHKNALVIAAPGSGKTTVIVNRVFHLVYNKGVNPDNIIVITFTKAAALNMKSRFLQLRDEFLLQNISGISAGSNNEMRTPFFGTFHALFYKILRRHKGDIKIIESYESHNIIKKVLLVYIDEINEDKVKEILNNISLFKSSGISLEEFEPAVDKHIFNDCYNHYENYKKEKGLLDFDDLQINCKYLFMKNPELLERYSRLFKYILVDEFQDCDALQLEILKMLNGDNSIFAVGDEDQCIYGFRGSKPECMVDFHNIFKGGEKLFLSLNYRSTDNIVDLSKVLIKNNLMRNEKQINAARKDIKDITILKCMNENGEADEIALKIEKLKALGNIDYKDNVVLYRTNVESRSLVDVFIRKKIPFRLMDKEYNFFEHFICKDLLAYFKLALDSCDRESFIKVINRPFRYVSKINLEKLKQYKYKEDCFEILSNFEGIPIFQVKTIKELKKDINYLNKLNLRSAVDFIIMDIGYIDYLREYSKKYKIDLSELEEVLEEFKQASLQFKNIPAFLLHVEEVAAELKKNSKMADEDRVILSTIHGVKGMEFKNVYIINCVEDILPHANSLENNIEEERRLMYVAITRAIDNLFMYIPRNLRGKDKEESRFIKECSLNLKKETSFGYITGDKVRHRAFGRGTIVETTDTDVSIQFEDGIMRKFDVVVLINNGLIDKVG